MKPEAAIRRINSFGKRFGSSRSHLYLAYHGAFLLALTPDLLYRIWANFQRDILGKLLNIPWIAVADLLLSNLCNEVGHELYEMDVAVRNELLKRLKEDSRFGEKRINELSNFLLAYVRKDLNSSESDKRDFAQSQRWMALAYKDSEEAARELALAFKKAYQQDRSELVRLAALTETLAQPLEEFEKLLIYARAMGHYARNRKEEAKNQVTNLPRKGRLVSISGVDLPIPLELIVNAETEKEQVSVSSNSQLNLIQSLLTCPPGEESRILQANQDLIDESLLITIKQVAAILADDGNEKSANYLRDMAAKLAEFVVEPSPYKDFLAKVLQATLDSKGNPQSVYPLLSANFDKLDDNFPGFLQAWATDILPSLEPEQCRGVAATIANFSNLIGQFPLGNRANNIEIAITGYKVGLSVFPREDDPESWANFQNNLGTVYSNRIRGERAENLEMALTCYYAALEITTREAFPERWAMTQNNLATAFSDRIRGERAENLEMALACYGAALEVTTREAFPERWARTQNNLANAYSNRIRGERADNIEMAIACYYAALEVTTREAFPEQWAMTQNNLATAYRDRIRGEKAENIERAIAGYEVTLQVYIREAFPEQWATTQNNLAIAYRDRIRGEKAENIERAIASYMAALEVYTREAFPQDWANTQNNLANAYLNRIRGDRAENIERAIASYMTALEVRTRDAFPEQWAMTQNNLATAFRDRIRGEKAENIERAIASYMAALEVYTREAFPQDWANTQNNLANAYLNRIRGDRAENIERAIAGYQATLEFYTSHNFPHNNAETLFNLGLAYKNLGNIYEAYHTLISAIKTVEFLRSQITSSYEAKQNHEENWNKLYETLVEVCIKMGDSAKALKYAEYSKARSFVDLLASRNIKYLDSSISQEKFINYSEIQALLDNKTAIIEWYIMGEFFLTFIITRETPSPIIWQSSASDLQALQQWSDEYLSTYYKTQQQTQWRKQLDSRLVQLSEILHIDEILSHIPATCSQLVLIPHRYLHIFPLHALPITIKGQDSYIIDRFHDGVQYAPSCQVLQLLQNRQHLNFSHFFAIQNPTNDLAFADLEVETISSYFPETTILAREQATKATFNYALERLSSAYCLHFSGHSLFNFSSPLHSVLVLSQNSGQTDSSHPRAIADLIRLLETTESELTRLQALESLGRIGVGDAMAIRALINFLATTESELTRLQAANILQKIDPGNEMATSILARFQTIDKEDTRLRAYIPVPPLFQPESNRLNRSNLDLENCLTLTEIYNLNLNQCHLVTLCGSETALTDFSRTTDEFIGFPSAFLYAGATNVVGSLWTLNDISAAFIMIKFYDNLSKGLPVVVALNQAQLWLKNVTAEELLKWADQFNCFSFKQQIEMDNYLRGYKSAEKPFTNPFYWAAFTVIGKREKSLVRLQEWINDNNSAGWQRMEDIIGDNDHQAFR